MANEHGTAGTGNRFYSREEWLRAKEVFFFRNRISLLDRLFERRYRFPQVLDCGTGIGSLIKHIAPCIVYGRIIGIDMENDLLSVAARDLCHIESVEFRQGDVQRLPFDDGAFDLVMSQELIDHVPDSVSAVREMYRVLKPGGTLLCLRNADSEIILEPESKVQHDIDARIIRNFNKYLLVGPGSDNRCGRKLWGYAVGTGLSDITIANTPWFLYPAPVLTPEEQRALRIVIEFFYKGSNNPELQESERIEQRLLDAWREERIDQIERGELVFYVNYFSLSATK